MNFAPSAGALFKKSTLFNWENDKVEKIIRVLRRVPDRFEISLFIAVKIDSHFEFNTNIEKIEYSSYKDDLLMMI